MIIDEKGPNHIGIILDGNRRWAKARGMKPTEGHKVGCERIEEIVDYAYECGLKYLTVYVFSTENWKRAPEEVDLLMQLLEKYTGKLLKSKSDKEIRVRVYGDITPLNEKLKKNIVELEEKTKDYTKMTFGICLNYGGRDELIRATKQIAQEVAEGKLSVEDITQDTISKRLYTYDVPDPDLIIRTSNEYRLSNFLTWQSTYSELYFPKDIMWPEFDANQLDKAILEFQNRNRRFGGN